MSEGNLMKNSAIYKDVFCSSKYPQSKMIFSVCLDNFRNKVQVLVSNVQEDMRDYTVHDISHLDALWEMASMIAPDLEINPAEAFVLGGAILLHDAGMTLAAYKNGLEEVRNLSAYQDALAYYSAGELGLDSKSAERMASVEALRTLHAERARSLATQKWRNPSNGDDLGLIDNSELEAHYGETIGRIAASHHWPHAKLVEEFSKDLGAIAGAPIEWTVDLIKVALLLRCADAIHIDHRRAPLMAYAIRSPVGISGQHWKFQNKIAKPHVSNFSIVYTSTKTFTAEEADAWYLAYDTIQMIDGELRSADEINLRLNRARFAVNSVRGADAPESLAQYVQVENWRPLPVNLKVTDVSKLARTLGGADLYNYPYAPLREIIQNAADAIDARLAVDKDFIQEDAKILLNVREENGKTILKISDNGVGMSERTLTNALLDFGSSFWKSADARQEMPGIGSALNKMRGRYGIGFFSVFMWADNVSVASRRFRDDVAATRVLEFKEGLSSRPLVRIANEAERSTKWNTQIEITLKKDAIKASEAYVSPYEFGSRRFSFTRAIDISRLSQNATWVEIAKQIGALLPFSLVVEQGGERVQVSVPDWKNKEGPELISLFTPMFFSKDAIAEKFSAGISEFSVGSEITGRAFLMPSEDTNDVQACALVVYDKGIFVGVRRMEPVFGFVETEVTNAARDRYANFALRNDQGWIKAASIKAFGICENDAEIIAIQRSLANIDAPDEGKPLFIFQRGVCSYVELLEKVSKTKKFRMRLIENDSDEFRLKVIDNIEPLYGLRIDSERAFALVEIEGVIIRDSISPNFWKNGESTLFKLISDIVGAIGAGAKVTHKLVEQESYKKDYIDIQIGL
ncbi:hypothetical protein XarbCFBP7629_17105 [Xanthomonas arboricola]|nr:hypothetical protein XarbCFBP7629_17105 [Xanthomonas arboricola]